MRADSLRRQLFKRLLWPLATILLFGSAFAYYFALRSTVNAYDLGLLDDALDISRQISVHEGRMTLNLPPAASQMLQINDKDRVSYALWDASGTLLAGNDELVMVHALTADENYIFKDIKLNKERHRALLYRGNVDGRVVYIVVAQTVRGRDRLTGSVFASILLPEALILALSIGIVVLGVRSVLTPVEVLRDEISSRSSTDLSPVGESTVPEELAPIIHGINTLLGNLSASFASHRRFIADAAHQLRTPLAGLSGQIEVALEEPPADVRKLLHQLLETTQRTTHLANQLLSLARLEHTEQSMYEVTRVDLREIMLEAAASFVSLAARKGCELGFDLHPCYVNGSPLMLRELFSNILDNAVRYTPAGGYIAVSLNSLASHHLLVIEDNGPGVPEEELAKLGTPFHRLPSNQVEGCGLGLAIVCEIVRLHGAEILFEHASAGRGLKVIVKFPDSFSRVI
jgi:two-component system sensor histidine kinase TctE